VKAVGAALAVIVALCAGLYLGGHPADLPGGLRDAFVDNGVGLDAVARKTIEERYYRATGSDRLENSSIAGMVDELRHLHKEDRYSHYFDPHELRQFRETTTGRFTGIGLSVAPVKQGLRVAAAYKGAPAAKAGVKVGDVIVAVDGHSIAGESSDAAIARIKGPTGTTVRVRVRSPGGQARTVAVKRARIVVPEVTERIIRHGAGKIGYVHFAQFTAGSNEPLRAAVQKLERRGAQGILLDLRGNPGGLLRQAVLASSIFIPKGRKVVETRSRADGNQTYRTKGDNLPARPIVVLIDRNTASAAEILAAALADDIGATVVGERSYGKGVFQQENDLPNGGALYLTTGEFFTPAGVSLFPKGIKPDRPARDLPRTRADEALARAAALLAAETQGR